MKLSIRCSSGEIFEVQIDPMMCVSELKDEIQKKANIEAQRQRLIYRGKVLKDNLTLSHYDVQDGHAIHLVKGSPPANANSPSASATSAAGGDPQQANSQEQQQQQQQQQNAFGGFFGAGGMDPNLMQQALNNPLTQQLLNNPDTLREMMMSNPAVRQVAQSNPEVAQILSDPELLRRSLEIMRNPNLMREMTRNTDRAMSNIEGMPGGFDALRRLYSDFQPLLGPTENNSGGNDPLMSLFGSQQPTEQQQQQQNSGNNNASNTQSSGTNTNPLPNPWGNSGAAGAGAGAGAGANPFAAFGMPGMGANVDFSQASQMMQNPAFQGMMSSMLSNPQFVDQLINSNPMISNMVQQMPQLRQMLSNPQFIQNVIQMQAAMQQQQPSGSGPTFPGFPPTTTPPPPPTSSPQSNLSSNTNTQSQQQSQPQSQQQQQQPPNPFLSLFGNAGAGNPFQSMFSGMNPSMNPSMGSGSFGSFPQQDYSSQNQQLKDMGFYDDATNLQALRATNGNVSAAVEWLLSHPAISTNPSTNTNSGNNNSNNNGDNNNNSPQQ